MTTEAVPATASETDVAQGQVGAAPVAQTAPEAAQPGAATPAAAPTVAVAPPAEGAAPAPRPPRPPRAAPDAPTELSVEDLLGVPKAGSQRAQSGQGNQSGQNARPQGRGSNQNTRPGSGGRPLSGRAAPPRQVRRSGEATVHVSLATARMNKSDRPTAQEDGPAGPLRVGMAYQVANSIIFSSHTGNGERSATLQDAFHRIVERQPQMSIIDLTTDSSALWSEENWKDVTRRMLADKGSYVRGKRPSEFGQQPVEVAAVLAAREHNGPVAVEYHFYTLALRDSTGYTFVGGLLYGRGTLRVYTAKLFGDQYERADLAELRAHRWAMETVEPHSHLMLVPSHPTAQLVWSGQGRETIMRDKGLTAAVMDLTGAVSSRDIKTRPNAEEPNKMLITTLRNLTAKLVAENGRKVLDSDLAVQ